jgi:hypothetical protein
MKLYGYCQVRKVCNFIYEQGVASQIMARMGYVVGQGLGKNSDGRAEPVPIQLLPQGKVV